MIYVLGGRPVSCLADLLAPGSALLGPAPVFVGEREPRRGAPGWSPLSPEPRESLPSSHRNLQKLLGVVTYRWVNLCPPRSSGVAWDRRTARRSASAVRWWAQNAAGRRLVLLGRLVADAFELELREPGEVVTLPGGVPALVLPHPSGRNRFWNDPELCSQMRVVFDNFMKEKTCPILPSPS